MKEMMNMARTKSIASIESQIVKAQENLVKTKAKYDTAAQNLEELLEKKKEFQAMEIMDAFIKSGKSYQEIMNFLNVGKK
jgi:hypothetical protein